MSLLLSKTRLDTGTVALALTPSSADVAAFVDQNTESLIFTPSGTEVAQFVDSNTESLLFTPSSTEEYTAYDTNTESLKLTPSGSDILEAVEAQIEYLVLTPSDTQVFGGTDQATETLVLTPSGVDTGQLGDIGTKRLSLGILDSSTVFSSSNPRWSVDIFGNQSSISEDESGLVTAVIGDTVDFGFMEPTLGFVDFSFDGVVSIGDLDYDNNSDFDLNFYLSRGFGISDPAFGFCELVYSGTTLSATIKDDFGNIVNTNNASISGNVWLRYRKSGNMIYAEYSTNGTSWTTLASADLNINSMTWLESLSFYLTLQCLSAGFVETIHFRDLRVVFDGISETTQYSDTATVNFGFTPSGVDDYFGVTEFIDSGTSDFKLVPNATDLHEKTDSATIDLRFTLTADEVRETFDSETATATLTPSGVEVVEYVELDTGILLLTPDGSDLGPGGVSDSASALIRFTPSTYEFKVITQLVGKLGELRYEGTVAFKRYASKIGIEEKRYESSVVFQRYWSRTREPV